MSWTAERLDALPDGTLITWTRPRRTPSWSSGRMDSYPEAAVRGDRSWRLLSGPEVFSEGVIEDADPGSISVVSVPIDALLSDETVWTSARHPQLLGKSARASDIAVFWVSIARDVLHRAVARITGEGST